MSLLSIEGVESVCPLYLGKYNDGEADWNPWPSFSNSHLHGQGDAVGCEFLYKFYLAESDDGVWIWIVKSFSTNRH